MEKQAINNALGQTRYNEFKGKHIVHVTPDDNGYGHSINFSSVDGDVLRVNGHLGGVPYLDNGIEEGSLFAAKMEMGTYCLYRLKNIRKCMNPRDMFFADAELAATVDEMTHDFSLRVTPINL